jgi:hypothetical protein
MVRGSVAGECRPIDGIVKVEGRGKQNHERCLERLHTFEASFKSTRVQGRNKPTSYLAARGRIVDLRKGSQHVVYRSVDLTQNA